LASGTTTKGATIMTRRSVSPPGDLIAEELEARGWNQRTLAEVMGTSPTLVCDVINAKRAITPDTAALLARAFGTSTQVWLGLEARYRASIARCGRAAKEGGNALWRENW
jgi:HTH-type transcriptional regulator/antitoxin HigA